MTRIRLRDARSPEGERELYARTYPGGYRHDVWPDHVERVAASVEMIRRYASRIRTVADLSCGDGAIVRGLLGMPHFRHAYLGDLNGVPSQADWGPLRVQTTVLPPVPLPHALNHLPQPVDLLVLSETIEHMDDPDALLAGAGQHARYLFVSTPENEIETSGNLEHYWSWGTADMHQMLQDAGWSPVELKRLVPQSTLSLEHAYHYQLWMAVWNG